MKHLLSLLTLIISLTHYSQSPQLLFHSGFEPNTDTISHGSSSGGIWGVDNSVPPPNDWIADLWTNIDTFNIQYKGGNDTMRLAELVSDPLDPTNTVLEYWIKYPNEVYPGGTKGRVSSHFTNIDNALQNVYYSVKMMVPGDYGILTDTIATFTWMTMMEFWNDLHLNSDYGFRITINMQKVDTAPGPMYFDVHAQTYDSISGIYVDCADCWEYHDSTFAIPLDEWFQVDIGFVEGDSISGQFFFAVTPAGGAMQVLFDVHDYTYHPGNPSPDGLTHFNAMKLYSGSELIDSLRNWGGLLHVYWDDFEIWKDSLVTTGTYELETPTFTIHPNPGAESFTIQRETSAEARIEVYDLEGRLVHVENNIGAIATVNVPDLVQGVYVIQLITDRGASMVKWSHL